MPQRDGKQTVGSTHSTPVPRFFDKKLWVEVDGLEGKLFLGFNPYTFPGRIAAWSETLQSEFYLSKSEIIAAADASWTWIAGYLKGCAPRPDDLYPSELYEMDNGERWNRWTQAIELFVETGDWTAGLWFELSPLEPDVPEEPQPFAVRSNEVWRWNGADWEIATPQPSFQETMIDGTVCWVRGHHDEKFALYPAHMICESCGFVTQLA
jgi:hypothetical protein